MEFKNGACLHVMLYGTFKENQYFLGDYKDSFDLIGFNSNIVAHAPDGIAAFVSQLKNKNYFIDPQTYAFTQSARYISNKDKNGKWAIKNSIKKLAEHYGTIINERINEKSDFTPILLSDFDEKKSKELCENVLNFELNTLDNAIKNSDYKDFLVDEEDKVIELKPSFLIAPYFLLDPDNLNAEIIQNNNFIKYSKELIKDKQIFAEMVLHEEIIDNIKFTNEIIKGYENCTADGIILWIDNLEESSEQITESYLNSYINFLKDMLVCNKPIILLHGSYLSIILSNSKYRLLAGVGHGIEYGESRSVIPVGGGVPTAKFYFPKFHKRVDYHPDAENILLEKKWDDKPDEYFKNVCDCNKCKEIIKEPVMECFSLFGLTKPSDKNNKLYPTSDALDLSRRHYLNNKVKEYDYCRKTQNNEILGDLEKNCKVADNIVSYSFNHLRKWHNVIK